MADESFNGLQVLMDYPKARGVFTAPGWKKVYCNDRFDRAMPVILEYWARYWHHNIEPIAKSHSDNWFAPRERRSYTRAGKYDLIGIHSYRPPGTSVGTGDMSNHRSASCLDINGHLHPYEATVLRNGGTYRDGFTQSQRDKIRALMRNTKDENGRSIGRTGLDFARGRRDGMHIEIAPLTTEWSIRSAARLLENEVGRSSTSAVWFLNAFGHDIREDQNRLAALGFKITSTDGHAGPETISALKAFQRAAGLKVDGRCGPVTNQKLDTYVPPAPKPIEPKEPDMPDLSQYRHTGKDRYETQALTALAQWPDGAPVVYLAEGYSYSDISTAQAFKDGPTLLTDDDRLPGVTADTIRTLGATRVEAVGGVNDKPLFEALQIVGVL